jgi:hypothetical protein
MPVCRARRGAKRRVPLSVSLAASRSTQACARPLLGPAGAPASEKRILTSAHICRAASRASRWPGCPCVSPPTLAGSGRCAAQAGSPPMRILAERHRGAQKSPAEAEENGYCHWPGQALLSRWDNYHVVITYKDLTSRSHSRQFYCSTISYIS